MIEAKCTTGPESRRGGAHSAKAEGDPRGDRPVNKETINIQTSKRDQASSAPRHSLEDDLQVKPYSFTYYWHIFLKGKYDFLSAIFVLYSL